MHLHRINVTDILVPNNRQRRNFEAEDLLKLASSIEQNGLIQPVVVRQEDDEFVLVAGERRIKAMQYIWDLFDGEVKCGEYVFQKGEVPCLYFGEMDELQAFEMELEENIRRVDLTWQERAEATAKLAQLRREQATEKGEALPTVQEIAQEIRGPSKHSEMTARKELAVSAHLDDEDVQKASTLDDAFKLLKRKEENQRHAELAKTVGITYSTADHDLRHGDCFEIMAEMEKEIFDVIVTDPPYGIDADTFNDSGGKAAGSHFYDDSWTTWNKLAKRLAVESYRICKPQAHIYIFCDVDNFVLLKSLMIEANWNVFRTPLVVVNPNATRAPWPEHGPFRRYQLVLYAEKGRKKVNQLQSDVLTYINDVNLGHPAQKPVNAYVDLLKRSCAPGDKILDPFGGTGPILKAAHVVKCYATYIEQDAASYGIALEQLRQLKELAEFGL